MMVVMGAVRPQDARMTGDHVGIVMHPAGEISVRDVRVGVPVIVMLVVVTVGIRAGAPRAGGGAIPFRIRLAMCRGGHRVSVSSAKRPRCRRSVSVSFRSRSIYPHW